MSKECIRNCPYIKELTDSSETDNLFAGPLPIHPDMIRSSDDSNTNRLLDACEASYDCPGSITTEEVVTRGLFKKRQETVAKVICGRDQLR